MNVTCHMLRTPIAVPDCPDIARATVKHLLKEFGCSFRIPRLNRVIAISSHRFTELVGMPEFTSNRTAKHLRQNDGDLRIARNLRTQPVNLSPMLFRSVAQHDCCSRRKVARWDPPGASFSQVDRKA